MDRNRGERGSRRRSDDEGASEFEERVVQINRVAKVVTEAAGASALARSSSSATAKGESAPDSARPTRCLIRFGRELRRPRSR